MQAIAAPISFLALATLAAAPAQAQWSQEMLSTMRKGPVAVTVNGKSFFAGGFANIGGTETYSDVVDIYDHASGAWTWIPLPSGARDLIGVTAVGNFVLFAGGRSSLGVSRFVDVLDTQTMNWTTANLTLARAAIMATTVGDYAIFAGGGFLDPMGIIMPSDVVDIYDASMGLLPDNPAAWSIAPPLCLARGGGAATTAGTQAIFAGGTDNILGGNFFADVDIYDASVGPPSNTAAWSTAMLSQPRAWLSATAVDGLAYFGGGQAAGVGGGTAASAVLDIYDASTGLWTISALSQARSYLAATSLGNTVLFAGGLDGGSCPSDVVDLINVGTDWATAVVLPNARFDLCATSFDGKAMFAGGTQGPGLPSDVVDVYEPVGINYCLAETNSTGGAATISATGSSSIAANDLLLRAEPVPNQPGVFFYGPQQSSVLFGNGTRCIAGQIGRLSVVNATGNVMTYLVNNTNPPSAATQITAGSTWNFQAWFRDPAAGGAFFDLSDGLAVTFGP